MSKDHTITIQKVVLEYFKEYDDDTFIQIVDAFVYSCPPKAKSKVGEIITKFIQDNGVEYAYINYVSDERDQSKFFKRTSMSQAGMIQDLKTAFLNAAFNRFRNSTLLPDVTKELDNLKDLVRKFMSPKDIDEFDDAIGDLRMMDWVRRDDIDED